MKTYIYAAIKLKGKNRNIRGTRLDDLWILWMNNLFSSRIVENLNSSNCNEVFLDRTYQKAMQSANTSS